MYKLKKQNTTAQAQKKIVIEFLEDNFGFFEITKSSLLQHGLPVKSTYLKILKLFKKHVPGGMINEVKKMSANIDSLFLAYIEYNAQKMYKVQTLKRKQFSRVLNSLTLIDDGREIVIYRSGRNQNLFVFPLPKKN